MDTTTLLSVIELIENQISHLEERSSNLSTGNAYLLADREAIHQLRLLMDHLQYVLDARLNAYESEYM